MRLSVPHSARSIEIPFCRKAGPSADLGHSKVQGRRVRRYTKTAWLSPVRTSEIGGFVCRFLTKKGTDRGRSNLHHPGCAALQIIRRGSLSRRSKVGGTSRRARQTLRESGHAAIVANAHKVRVIYDNSRKGYRAGAHSLARLACLDVELHSPIEPPIPSAPPRLRTALPVLRPAVTECRAARLTLLARIDELEHPGCTSLPGVFANDFKSSSGQSLAIFRILENAENACRQRVWVQ